LVEKIGVDRSRELAEESDLIIAIFDLSRPFDHEDDHILELIKDKNAIIILNKTDLEAKFDKDLLKLDIPIIEASVKNDQGIAELENLISEMFETKEINRDSVLITNVRHERLLRSANQKLEESLKDIKMMVPIDCIEVDLRSSYNDLGLIIGESVSDEIMDKVFKEFCVGK
jgi:tRNA modification GTPase